MDKPESHSFLANREQNLLVAKRAAAEDPNTTTNTKRFKGFDNRVPFPEKPAVLEERNGEIQFQVVNNNGLRTSTIILTGLKNLFQKQLPKIPKDYIARLVYDRTYVSLALVKSNLEVIGGISIREFRDRKFAEIVFCAVSSNQQVKGYGSHLIAHLKDFVKASSLIMHFLTYADNNATGYFRKQGGRMLLKQKETIQAKIHPLSIPAIRATGWSPGIDELAREPRHGPHFNELQRFLKDEVPDYYNVITSPMDLSTIEERLEHDYYTAPRDLVNNLKLTFSNCRKYNDVTTVYAKCAVRMEKYIWSLIKEIPEWLDLLET
ncbi:hypothetical protein CC78DRAFT_554363 [Lojkania enalia]|uniref:Histone acetyltransferase n=1 Tax=Lojkania enalia TaxID=147567 RepID=A0A9P4K6V6_9PLEO|nr:hypothetical protein CC78DRAFT_554363 [Didymosphaeria enalia]